MTVTEEKLDEMLKELEDINKSIASPSSSASDNENDSLNRECYIVLYFCPDKYVPHYFLQFISSKMRCFSDTYTNTHYTEKPLFPFSVVVKHS